MHTPVNTLNLIPDLNPAYVWRWWECKEEEEEEEYKAAKCPAVWLMCVSRCQVLCGVQTFIVQPGAGRTLFSGGFPRTSWLLLNAKCAMRDYVAIRINSGDEFSSPHSWKHLSKQMSLQESACCSGPCDARCWQAPAGRAVGTQAVGRVRTAALRWR
jgi:hypothetical protein